MTCMRRSTAVRVTVPQPLEGPLPKVSAESEIDRLVLAKLAEPGLPPSPLCTGQEFLRRAYLDVIVLPDNPRIAPGQTVLLTADAVRTDGFAGEITLAMKNLPKGFAARGMAIPPGLTEAHFTITAPPDVPLGLLSRSPALEGTARIGPRTGAAAARSGPAGICPGCSDGLTSARARCR